jgi:hypothetical protein
MKVRFCNITMKRRSMWNFRRFLHCLLIFQSISTFITNSEAFTRFSTGTTQVALSSDRRYVSTISSSTLLLAAKKSISMVERRRLRQQKSQGTASGRVNPFADLPPSKLNEIRSTSSTTESQQEDPILVDAPSDAAEKAKELLIAQRASVNMLTHVRERAMERLSPVEVMRRLEDHGYAIIDDFLNEESILTQLEEEGQKMLLSDASEGGMAGDISNLGTGEYIAKIEGGSKQYVLCPRIVELVVSTTKNLPAALENATSPRGSIPLLDPSACMATLRVFDRKALKASLSLLTRKDDDSILDDYVGDKSTPLAMVVSDDSDQRKLSLHYYVVSDKWNEEFGGGLLFEAGIVPAKRDRLIIFQSDATKFKPIPWKGSDIEVSTMIASSIELHLVKKR